MPTTSASTGARRRGSWSFDRSYIETNGPTVSDRLVKAGIRLGGLLNEALGR